MFCKFTISSHEKQFQDTIGSYYITIAREKHTTCLIFVSYNSPPKTNSVPRARNLFFLTYDSSIDEVEMLRKKHEGHEGLLMELSEAEDKARKLNRMKVRS